MERRLYERKEIESDVVIIRESGDIHCKSLNLSGSGACFLIKKELVPDIDEWTHNTELKFKFQSDADHDAQEGLVPIYTCYVMHTDEVGDDYKIGVQVSEDVSL